MEVAADEKRDSELAVLLAEYQAGRAEILSRSDRQWTLVQIYAAVATGLIGFSITDESLPWYWLLAIPVTASATWFLFRDHDEMIQTLAEYQETALRERLVELSGTYRVLGWEDFLRSRARTSPLPESVHFAGLEALSYFQHALVILLLGPAIASVLLVLHNTDEIPALGYLAWIVAIAPLWDFVLWLRSDIGAVAPGLRVRH